MSGKTSQECVGIPISADVLAIAGIVMLKDFARLLQDLLDENRLSKGDLHDFLLEKGYEIEKTSLYKYFNPDKPTNRLPSDEHFLILFAEFVRLSQDQRETLIMLWEIHKVILRHRE